MSYYIMYCLVFADRKYLIRICKDWDLFLKCYIR